MSTTSTFRLGDLVWIAETLHNGQDFALRYGIVKRVERDGLLVTVDWTATGRLESITTVHIANNLAYTADEAIQKFIAWATSVLNAHKHAYEKEAVEKQDTAKQNTGGNNMKDCFKPGDIVWHAEKGVVRMAQIADVDQHFFFDATIITFPQDTDPHQTWGCRDGYLFMERKEAIEEACKQLQQDIDDRKKEIQGIELHIKNQQAILQARQEELRQLQ